MSPPGFFYLAGALRRNKSTPAPVQKIQNDGKDSKAQLILGITEADINTLRNQSLGSPWSAKLANSFSDASTELGTSVQKANVVDDGPELHLKASSTLLRDEYLKDTDTVNSTFSRGLRNYGSSSTLRSYYDRGKQPLAISQQTSDSSRRDFALRKGLPMVVESVTPEQDSRLQLKFFKTSKSRSRANSKMSSKTAASSVPACPPVSASQRSVASSKSKKTLTVAVSSRSFVAPSETSFKRQNTTRTFPVPVQDNGFQQKVPIHAFSTPVVGCHVKVHVKRPRAGVKNWFDDVHDDISEDEITHVTPLQPGLSEGDYSTFRNGSAGRVLNNPSFEADDTLSSPETEDNLPTPRTSKFPPIPSRPTTKLPKIATLNARASESNMSHMSFTSRLSREKTSPLTNANLNHDSILDLSSSDDEDDVRTINSPDTSTEQPAIRDSIASDLTQDPEVEVGTARTINAAAHPVNFTPIPRPKSGLVSDRPPSSYKPPTAIPLRRSSRMLSYLSDGSSEPAADGIDARTSSVVTPIDTLSSCRASVLSSVYVSDDASIESRRLMSVTRQEESLLAAMRLKKATMKYSVAHASQSDISIGESVDSNMAGSHLDSASYLHLDSRPRSERSRPTTSRRSTAGDVSTPIRDSGTTFQTDPPHLPHPQFSSLNIATDLSANPSTRLSFSSQPSLEHSISPSLLSMSTSDRRGSRDTYLSTSTTGDQTQSRSQSRSISRGSHIVALDGLHQVPQRDEIRSQDFISWPYKGWDARAKIAVAH